MKQPLRKPQPGQGATQVAPPGRRSGTGTGGLWEQVERDRRKQPSDNLAGNSSPTTSNRKRT